MFSSGVGRRRVGVGVRVVIGWVLFGGVEWWASPPVLRARSAARVSRWVAMMRRVPVRWMPGVRGSAVSAVVRGVAMVVGGGFGEGF